ncbi:MAG: DUF4595 domain-containing protein [Prevotella sp.]|jgi:hypothetical protein|nr:DUF4595 domain-containing protein [Prevotella sp.]
MKQIKLFSVMLLLATLTLSFNACSSDDDDDSNNGANGKKITKIVNEYGEDNVRTEIFSYSNGKMSKYTAQYDGGDTSDEFNQTITYGNNTVTLTGLLDSHECVQTYTLNNSGLAISCTTVNKEDGEYRENYTFEYSDGYLIGISCSGSGYTETLTFTYSNGNITKAIERYDKESISYTFSYSENVNISRLINPLLDDDLLFVHKPAYYMGILGKSTKNLAVSCTEKYSSNSYDYTCVYALDNDNYVKTATLSNGDKLTYTFE